ncbi:class 1 fructose-bisphosphatase [Pseudonocardia adelaidensis]|uniref:Fructose-1,6-bisphosphatase class 1 n=1 Tax=Pseudonocardia adelaidensis TaxID=648754 RepID=A0ABP9NDR0_9PSEU
MPADRTTLAQFLVEDRRRHRAEGADLDSLILHLAVAGGAVAEHVAGGALHGTHGGMRHELAMIAEDYFLRAAARSGRLAGMASDELHVPSAVHPRGDYLLAVDPLDGSPGTDPDACAGSIFSILRTPWPGVGATAQDFLQPGTAQVCAGYALYGQATALVLTLGRGVYAFTLDPARGEFVLTREALRVPPLAGGFVIDASHRRFRQPAVHQAAPLAAEAHRILTRGGVYAGPGHKIHAVNAVAFLVEQAGGAASTGRGRALDVVPTALHQRSPLIVGTAAEVALVDRCAERRQSTCHGSTRSSRSPARPARAPHR